LTLDSVWAQSQVSQFPGYFKYRLRVRIQLASDLHLELLEPFCPLERLIAPALGADVLVLAGDIHRGVRAIKRFADWPVPVLYLAGNHEYYRGLWEEVRSDLRRDATGTAVHFLDNDAVTLGGVRFLGSTLWTDYQVSGEPQATAMEAAEATVLDHQRINTRCGLLRARQALDEHLRSRGWLERELSQNETACTVVITHHAPHPGSIHPRYAGNPVNGAFVSDLTSLVERADLWLHGHVHDSFDYRIGRCRVVCNPRGYAQNRKTVSSPGDLQFENPAFRPDLVIELPDR
jgi:DNA repair exonuclease SbcCD nuclease subunit